MGWPDTGWLVGGPASSRSVRPSTSLASRLSLSWGWGGGPKSRSQLPSEDAEWGPCPRPLVESSLRHWRPGSSPCARSARDTAAPPQASHFGRKLWMGLPMACQTLMSGHGAVGWCRKGMTDEGGAMTAEEGP